MHCADCGVPLEETFFGPLVPGSLLLASSIPCRNGYPLYDDNGMHSAALGPSESLAGWLGTRTNGYRSEVNMKCNSCDQEISDGEEVEVSYPAVMVAGTLRQMEEETIRHLDGCGEED